MIPDLKWSSWYINASSITYAGYAQRWNATELTMVHEPTTTNYWIGLSVTPSMVRPLPALSFLLTKQ